MAGAVPRWLSLTGRVPFASPAASSLLLVGMVAAFLGVKSGMAAHGPVERIPGVAPAVMAHEQWGDRAHSVPAVLCLYEAAAHGGDLVYSYAGGPGLRTGKPEDVSRLFIAGVYNQSQVDRRSGRPQDAAAEIGVAAARFPSDPSVQLMAAESALLDRKDPPAALDILGRVAVAPSETRLRLRHGMLMADALEAAGRPDAAAGRRWQCCLAWRNGFVSERRHAIPCGHSLRRCVGSAAPPHLVG